jgi:hypothetical protein
VCNNHLADPNNDREDDFTHFFDSNPTEYIELLLQFPPFGEYMSNAPAQGFNNTEKHIYSEVKWTEWG